MVCNCISLRPVLYVLRRIMFFCHLSLPLKKAPCYVIASSTNENDPGEHNGVSHIYNMTWAWAETWCSRSTCCPDHCSQTLKVANSNFSSSSAEPIGRLIDFGMLEVKWSVRRKVLTVSWWEQYVHDGKEHSSPYVGWDNYKSDLEIWPRHILLPAKL